MKNDTDDYLFETDDQTTDEQELKLLILSQAADDIADNRPCEQKVVTILQDKDCVTFNDRTAEDITLLRQAARDWWNDDCSAYSWENVSIGGWF